jgi:hypothetical protein
MIQMERYRTSVLPFFWYGRSGKEPSSEPRQKQSTANAKLVMHHFK